MALRYVAGVSRQMNLGSEDLRPTPNPQLEGADVYIHPVQITYCKKKLNHKNTTTKNDTSIKQITITKINNKTINKSDHVESHDTTIQRK